MRLILLFLCAALAGCAARGRFLPVAHAFPPARSGAPRLLRLTWEYDPEATNIVFEIWSSPDLLTWSQEKETPLHWCPVMPTLEVERRFYRVRARDTATGEVSDWATGEKENEP